jgi:uncharacterized YccA/Bax inhibitor family protein
VKLAVAVLALGAVLGLIAVLLPVLLRSSWSAAELENAHLNLMCLTLGAFSLLLPRLTHKPPSRALTVVCYASATCFGLLLAWGVLRSIER